LNSMTVSFVLVRLAAVFLFVRGVQGLSSFSYLLTGDAQLATFAIVTLIFGVFLPAGIAIVMWRHPEKVIGPQLAPAKPDSVVSAVQLLMIGISLLGLYSLVYGLVDLLRIEAEQMSLAQFAASMNLPNEAADTRTIGSRIAYSAQIALGVCLILGRNGLSWLLVKAKYGGILVPPTA